MSTQSSANAARGDSHAYAESLYAYAAERLDPFSLHCWIVQRLMLDEGIEHERAEEAFELVLDRARTAERDLTVRDLERRRRRESIRAFGRGAHGSTSRRLLRGGASDRPSSSLRRVA